MRFFSVRTWTAIASLLLAAGVTAQTPIAFPGAYGFGAAATGGRGGTIYHVTNLNDSGAGSFRDATSVGHRIIVFDVGGYIALQSPVSVTSNLTILGQTAPGGGIGTMGREISLSNSANIIMRNMRIRQGSLDPDTGKSALNMGTGNDIILDQCSFEYGVFDGVDAVGTTNFTVSNSIIADPIGQQFNAHIEVGPSTLYRNLWVNAHNRQPLAKDSDQYINNVIYNYQAAYTAANTGGIFSHDIISNYFITGPSTTSAGDAFYQMNNTQSAYAVGNMLDSNKNGILDGSAYNTVGSALVLNAPWAATTTSIPTLSAAAAYASLVASVGAMPRDQVDAFVLNDVTSLGTSGKIYSNQSSTGLANDGYGIIASGTQFTETSNSGIPDYWAVANGISTSDANAGTYAYGSTGYENVEVYANSLVLPAPWSALDLTGTPVQGQSSYNPFTGQWLLTGSGLNQTSTVSQGQFASQPWTADGTLAAEVLSVAGSGSSAGGGLLFTGTGAAGTSFVALLKTGSGGLSFIWQNAGGSAQGIQLRRSGSPLYLKIVTSNGTYSGYYSTDGTNYTLLGSESVTFPGPVQAGLVFSSGSATALGTATFSNVSVGP
jgi:hypothetical protein